MSELLSLKQVQQRTNRLVIFEDGLWDILLASIFMLLAIYPITRALIGPAWNLGLFIGLMLLAIAGQVALRGLISTPRLGYAEPKRSRAHLLILSILIGLVALTLGLVILTLVSPGWLPANPASNWFSRYVVELVVLLALGGLFSGMAYAFGVLRLYLYGWLLGGANLLGVVIYDAAYEGFNLPLGIAAAIILLIGVGLLIRFIRKYPLRDLEAGDGQ